MNRSSEQIFDEALVLHAQAGRREALERLAVRWRARHFLKLKHVELQVALLAAKSNS